VKRRRITQTTILTPREVELAAEGIAKLLGPRVMSTLSSTGSSIRDGVRFHPVGASCTEAREQRGLTLRDAAHRLRAPQYRLRAVENSSFAEIEPEILKQYIGFLKLDSWLARWARANPELARRLGVSRRAAGQGARSGIKSHGRNLTTG